MAKIRKKIEIAVIDTAISNVFYFIRNLSSGQAYGGLCKASASKGIANFCSARSKFGNTISKISCWQSKFGNAISKISYGRSKFGNAILKIRSEILKIRSPISKIRYGRSKFGNAILKNQRSKAKFSIGHLMFYS